MFLGDPDPHLAADSSLSVVRAPSATARPLEQRRKPTKSESVEYSAVRTHRGAPKATFAANYRPIGPVYHSAPGSLDSWLTDRYCLSAVDDAGNLYRGEIDHDRWPLQPSTHPRYSNVRLARTCGVVGY
jgi:uncharacterized protein YqjF (DUF2071 family)